MRKGKYIERYLWKALSNFTLVLLFFVGSWNGFAQSPGGVSSNLQYWMMAEVGAYEDDPGTDACEDEDEVLDWVDQSSNGVTNTGSSGTAPTYETTGFNFNHVLNFNGSNEYMSVDDLSNFPSGAGNRTLFAVVKPDVVTGNRTAFSYGTTTCSQANGFWCNGTTASYMGFCDDVSATNYLVANEPVLMEGHYNGTTAYFFKDGEEENNAGKTWNTSSSTGFIGRQVNSDEYWYGDIAEIIVYDAVLSNLNRLQVESYLAIKYGITLTSDNDGDASAGETISGSVTEGDYVASDGSTVIWDYSANSSYHYDIAGIGRDETSGSGLNQKQSKSNNSDAILTISTQAIAVDNTSNVTSLTEDTYLLWGNNNASPNAAFSDMPAGYTARLGREWVVEMTGTVSDVHVEFNIAGLGLAGGGAEDFYLLTDADGDFTSGASATAATSFSSNKVTFDDFDFTDGQYFTLATTQVIPAPGAIAANLQYWMMAEAGVYEDDPGSNACEDEDEVLDWVDQSPNAITNTGSGGTAPTYETTGINYNHVLNFNGSNEYMSVDDLSNLPSGAGNRTLYAVVKSDVVTGMRTTFAYGTNTISQASGFWGNGTTGAFYGFDGDDVYASNYFVADKPVLMEGHYNGTTAYFFKDAKEVANEAKSWNTVNNVGYIGRQVGGVEYWDGDIAEIISYDAVLSNLNRLQVESYLAVKYGITLTNDNDGDASAGETISGSITEGDYVATDGSTVIWDYSNETAYHNDIIGIGRDDITALNQKQSHTLGDSLKLYIGSLSADNSSNAGAITNDVSYVIIGHNKGLLRATTASNAEKPAGINSRLEREWKVTNTNFDDDFSLEFEWDNIGSINLSHIRLLVDADGDFSNATVYNSGDQGMTFSLGSIIISDIPTTVIPKGSTRFITIGSTDDATPLPIELYSFETSCVEDFKITFEWTTLSESNNDIFTLEFSTIGNQFKELVSYPAAGNSNKILNYKFQVSYDGALPVLFRLKQTDYDGIFSYSGIVEVSQCDEDNKLKILNNGDDFGDNIAVDLYITYDTDISIILFDAISRIIQVNSFRDVLEGHNTFPLKNLPPGFYMVKVTLKNMTYTEKIIVR